MTDTAQSSPDTEGISLTAFQQEEKQRRRILVRQRRVHRDARQLEKFVRLHEPNRYRRVYQMLAFDKIIKEIALQGSVGTVSFELLDRPGAEKNVKMIVEHTEMNAPGIREKIETESKKTGHEYTLYKALCFMTEIKLTTGAQGGIRLEVVKELNQPS